MTAFGDNVHGARSSQKTAVASCTLSLLLSASTSRSCLQKSKTLPEQGLLFRIDRSFAALFHPSPSIDIVTRRRTIRITQAKE